MSYVTKKKRSERSSPLELPPSVMARSWEWMQRGDVLLRVAICLVAAMVVSAVTKSWYPPFSYRSGHTAERAILSRTKLPNPTATAEARRQAMLQIRYVYRQDPVPLIQLRDALKNRVAEIVTATELTPELKQRWREFFPSSGKDEKSISDEQLSTEFDAFRAAMQGEGKLAKFEADLTEAFIPMERQGLLENLQQKPNEGNQAEILVLLPDDENTPQRVQVKEVRIPDAAQAFHQFLKERVEYPIVADRCYDWLLPQLPVTLRLDQEATDLRAKEAAEAVEEQTYPPGYEIVPYGEPISVEQLPVLRIEHENLLSEKSWPEIFSRWLAIMGMYVALSTLCSLFLLYRQPELLTSLSKFSTLVIVSSISIVLAYLGSGDTWRAELIPLMFFGMSMAIAYRQDLALLLSAAIGLIIIITIGQGLFAYVLLMTTTGGTVLALGRIRNRTRLTYLGILGGAIAFSTAVGVGILDGQPLGQRLFSDAAWYGLCAITTGFLMTGLLPFIEQIFGIITDISLLQLGDAAHPLLQELVRRAPGTYNHSINVASISEAAAERIGARGLLVRVGAYFHDIGKMLKPGYFIENQALDSNRHESLVPAMSTLIIIAHVKDGADLARRHHLPQPIIDFIQQHHGTTLVEYFYRRASQQSEDDPDSGEVNENSFRYPGPKPQTREAAVLMVADAVESACRVLVEPTPSRIEHLVQEIAMKRLLDGQFDECDLTLRELRAVSDSLVKSLIAVYHGRVKYPEATQSTA